MTMNMDGRVRVMLRSRLITNRVALTVTAPDHGKQHGDRALKILKNGFSHYLFPASSERGMMRRAIVNEALTPAGAPFGTGYQYETDHDALVNISGGVKGTGVAEMPALEDQLAFRARNPVIDLFGCGHPAFIGGALRVGDLISIEPMPATALIRRGVRHNPFFKENIVKGGLTESYNESETLKAFIRNLESVAKQYVAMRGKDDEKTAALRAAIFELSPDVDFEKFDAWRKTTVAQTKAKIIDLGHPDVSIQNLFSSIEEIPAGTEFTQEISIYALPDRIGLYLTGVGRQIFNDPAQGGKRAAGCGGNIYREYDFYVLSPDEKWVRDATIIFDPGTVLDRTNESRPPQGLVIEPETPCFARTCVDEWKRNKHSGKYAYNLPAKKQKEKPPAPAQETVEKTIKAKSKKGELA